MQGFRAVVVSALLAFTALCTSPAAQAQAKTFTVGVEQTDYYPVYAYRGGQYQGFSRDLLDAFGKSKGYTFNYVSLPILRLFSDFLTKDNLDFKYPDNPQWQTGMKKGIAISYSKPLFESIEGGMVLPANKGKPLSALKTLGTIRGFTPWPYQDALAAKKLSLEESDNLSSLVQKAMLGRLDVIFINQAIADYHLSQELKKPGALVLDPGLPNNGVSYLLSSRKQSKVVAEFDAFLAANAALVAQLKAKYKLK